MLYPLGTICLLCIYTIHAIYTLYLFLPPRGSKPGLALRGPRSGGPRRIGGPRRARSPRRGPLGPTGGRKTGGPLESIRGAAQRSTHFFPSGGGTPEVPEAPPGFAGAAGGGSTYRVNRVCALRAFGLTNTGRVGRSSEGHWTSVFLRFEVPTWRATVEVQETFSRTKLVSYVTSVVFVFRFFVFLCV